MSLIYKILDYDLMRTRSTSNEGRPFFIENPGRKEFLPSVVSTMDKGRFLINNSITKDSKIRSGAFSSSEETIDEVLVNLFEKAFECSQSFGFKNIFTTDLEAIEYIRNESGYKYCPMWCLTGSDSSHDENPHNDTYKMLYVIGLPRKIFLSKPDYVGLITRLPNNFNSIILHNVKSGIAFV